MSFSRASNDRENLSKQIDLLIIKSHLFTLINLMSDIHATFGHIIRTRNMPKAELDQVKGNFKNMLGPVRLNQIARAIQRATTTNPLDDATSVLSLSLQSTRALFEKQIKPFDAPTVAVIQPNDEIEEDIENLERLLSSIEHEIELAPIITLYAYSEENEAKRTVTEDEYSELEHLEDIMLIDVKSSWLRTLLLTYELQFTGDTKEALKGKGLLNEKEIQQLAEQIVGLESLAEFSGNHPKAIGDAILKNINQIEKLADRNLKSLPRNHQGVAELKERHANISSNIETYAKRFKQQEIQNNNAIGFILDESKKTVTGSSFKSNLGSIIGKNNLATTVRNALNDAKFLAQCTAEQKDIIKAISGRLEKVPQIALKELDDILKKQSAYKKPKDWVAAIMVTINDLYQENVIQAAFTQTREKLIETRSILNDVSFMLKRKKLLDGIDETLSALPKNSFEKNKKAFDQLENLNKKIDELASESKDVSVANRISKGMQQASATPKSGSVAMTIGVKTFLIDIGKPSSIHSSNRTPTTGSPDSSIDQGSHSSKGNKK